MGYSQFPCAMANSTTPVTGGVSWDAYTLGRAMDRGAAEMRALIENLGGVWPGAIANWGALLEQGDGGGVAAGKVEDGWRLASGRALPEACGASELLSSTPGQWIPSAPSMTRSVLPVVTPVATRVIERSPAPVVVDDSICSNITPENICEAAVRGCFAAGQVEAEQLLACSRSGWQGNLNQFPALVARGGAMGGQRFGVVNASPRTPRGDAAPQLPGLGLEGVGSAEFNLMGIGAIALGGVLIWATFRRGGRG